MNNYKVCIQNHCESLPIEANSFMDAYRKVQDMISAIKFRNSMNLNISISDEYGNTNNGYCEIKTNKALTTLNFYYFNI
jgi:hypothetical protein